MFRDRPTCSDETFDLLYTKLKVIVTLTLNLETSIDTGDSRTLSLNAKSEDTATELEFKCSPLRFKVAP